MKKEFWIHKLKLHTTYYIIYKGYTYIFRNLSPEIGRFDKGSNP